MTFSQQTSFLQCSTRQHSHSLFVCGLTLVGQALSEVLQRDVQLGYAQQTSVATHAQHGLTPQGDRTSRQQAQGLTFDVASVQYQHATLPATSNHTATIITAWQTAFAETQQKLQQGLQACSPKNVLKAAAVTTPEAATFEGSAHNNAMGEKNATIEGFVGAEISQALPNIVEHPLLPQQGQHPITVYFRQLENQLQITITVDDQWMNAATLLQFQQRLWRYLHAADIATVISRLEGPFLAATFHQQTLNAQLASAFHRYAHQPCVRRDSQGDHQESPLSYQQLWQQANALAGGLLQSNFATLAIGCHHKSNAVRAILAALMLGKPFVMVEPLDHNKRRQHILASVPHALLVDDARIEEASCQGNILVNDDQFNESILFANAAPEDCVCYTFTSGTTGKPKGIAIKQIALLNVILTRHALVNITAEDVMLHNISFSFDPALWQLFGALGFGAGLLLQDDAEVLDSSLTHQLLQHTTLTDFVPSVLNKLIDSLPPDARFPKLRVLYVGGEVFTPALYAKLQPRASARIFNQYGPSECSIDSLAQEISALAPEQAIAIGTPIANSTAIIVDEHDKIVPQGERGELLIGGINVSDGYVDNALNANAFCIIDGERFYRSGDVCELDKFGHITFKGRIDRQVKLNGIRVELEELETRLTQVPEVSAAFAVFKADVLTVYLTLSNADISIASPLKRQLLAALPRCAAAANFRLLREVPHNSSGKPDASRFEAFCVDATNNEQNAEQQFANESSNQFEKQSTHQPAKALESSALELPTDSEAPKPTNFYSVDDQKKTAVESNVLPIASDELQAQCRLLLAQILKCAELTNHDDFFAMGGNSLQVIDVILAVKKQFDVEVPVPALMVQPTAVKLAHLVAQGLATQGGNKSDAHEFEPNVREENLIQRPALVEIGLSPEMRLLSNEAPLTSHLHWLFFSLEASPQDAASQSQASQRYRAITANDLCQKAQQIDALRLCLQRKNGALGLRDSGAICRLTVKSEGSHSNDIAAIQRECFAQLDQACQQGNLPLFAVVEANNTLAVYLHRGLFDGYCAGLLQQAFLGLAPPSQFNGFIDYVQQQNQTEVMAVQRESAQQFVQTHRQALRAKHASCLSLALVDELSVGNAGEHENVVNRRSENNDAVNNLPEALAMLWTKHRKSIQADSVETNQPVPPLYVGVLAVNRYQHNELQAVGRFVNVVPLLIETAEDIDRAIQQVIEWRTPFYHVQAALRRSALSQLKFDVIIHQHVAPVQGQANTLWHSYSAGQELAHLGKAVLEI